MGCRVQTAGNTNVAYITLKSGEKWERLEIGNRAITKNNLTNILYVGQYRKVLLQGENTVQHKGANISFPISCINNGHFFLIKLCVGETYLSVGSVKDGFYKKNVYTSVY